MRSRSLRLVVPFVLLIATLGWLSRDKTPQESPPANTSKAENTRGSVAVRTLSLPEPDVAHSATGSVADVGIVTQRQPRPVATPDSGQLSQETLRQIASLEREKQTRTPAQNKVDSQLLFAAKTARGESITPEITNLAVDLDWDEFNRVLVDVTAEVTEGLLEQIRACGGEVVNAFAQYDAVRARIPLLEAERLAGFPGVSFLRPAVRALRNAGSVDSEGNIAHAAGTARTRYGVDGRGVKVGVLSDSVDYLEASQNLEDLGTVTVLTGQSGVPASGEGTAMLEIVHDLAPGAELYYATAFNGPASFANNIKQLRAAGCDVIIDDVSYSNESPFQDGVIARAVNEVTADGALFFSSAGNSGNKNDDESGVWEGDYVDSGQTAQDGKVHSFGNASHNSAIQGGSPSQTRVDLFWADPLGNSQNDYDVYIANSSGAIVAASNNTQNGSQDPYEAINKLEAGQRVIIVKYSGAPRYLHLGTGRGRLANSTGGQTKGHSCAEAAFCVAAVSARDATGPFTASYKVETFSSDGPRRVFFNADGTPITPGNFSSSGGSVRQKPDLAAADGVRTTLPGDSGLNPFFGTSAAAPHAGAIAALLKSLNPDLTAAEFRELLTTHTLDLEGAGIDRDAGHGLLMADLLLQAGTGSGAPTIVSFAPTNGVAGSEIRITGTKFTGLQSVKFNGVLAEHTLESSTQIRAIVPATATTGPISVSTPAGTATSVQPFRVASEPAITGISPGSGSPGTTVTIVGANLTGATSVKFGTVSAASFEVRSSQEIAAVVPNGATTGKITVTTPDGTASSPANFVVSTLPVIVGFNPPRGGVGTEITITGANLNGATAVSFNGIPSATIIPVSASSLRATVPPGAATGPLRVSTPAGSATAARDFVVVLPPTIGGLTPASGPPGTVVAISGTALTDASAVTFNGVAAAAFSVSSDVQVIATVPPAASTGPVRLTTPGGTSAGVNFTVIAGPPNNNFAAAQIITGQSGNVNGSTVAATREIGEPPHAGNIGGRSVWYRWTAPSAGAWRFDTVGSGFDTLLAIYTGDDLAQLALVAGNDDIVAGVNTNSIASFVATAGQVYQIAVDGFSPESGNAASGTVKLSWASETVLPSISGFAPTSGSPGTTVMISGANLGGATEVRFNGVAATDLQALSAAQVSAKVPAGASTGPIAVTTPGGTATSTAQFSVSVGLDNDLFANSLVLNNTGSRTNSSNANASREAGEPAHAGNNGGRSVWFVWTAPNAGVWTFDTVGSTFDTLLAVYSGNAIGALAAVGASDDAGGLRTSRVSFAAAANATYRIAVDGYGGDSGNITLQWSFAPETPSIAGFSPASGPVGTPVMIQGANLGGTIGVRFGNVSAPDFAVNSASQVSVTVPPRAASAPITVLTTNGSASSSGSFVLTGPKPANDDFAGGATLSGPTVTAVGENVGATSEAGEPAHDGRPAAKSVWWKWTAPASGTYAVTTRGSSFDTVLGVYTGTSLGNLIKAGSNDDGPNMGTDSRLLVEATSGQVFSMAVDGYDGDSGEVVLSIFPTESPDLLFYTGFELSEGYSYFGTLAGQQNWQQAGQGDSGVLFSDFGDGSNQGYIGYYSPVGDGSASLWPPLSHVPDTTRRPVVTFSTFLAIVDSSNGHYDQFGWDVYNRNGDFLLGVAFDNLTMEVISYLEDGAPRGTGLSFANNEILHLEISMDFARNRWSATLDGKEVVREQAITSTGAALDLGDIDASWSRVGGYGDNYMSFDDYLVLAEPSQKPRIILPPADQQVVAGSTAIFRVTADSTAELHYQWRCNGQNIPSADGPALHLTRVVVAQAGDYDVIVSNSAGSIISPTARLSVAQPPNLTPAHLPGWSDSLVLGDGITDAAPLFAGREIKASWAVRHANENAPAAAPFFVHLLVDGALKQSWRIPALNPGAWVAVTNYSLGQLAAGPHIARLETDATDAVVESEENDNVYTRQFTVIESAAQRPALSGAARRPSGEFQFSLSGAPNARYEVQVSSDLVQWTTTGAPLVANQAGLAVYTENSATGSKFYRVRVLP